jgi:hypothetical protein
MLNSKRKIYGALIAIVFVGTSANLAHAEAWTPAPVPEGSYGFSVADLAYGPETFSHISTLSPTHIDGMPNEYLCNDSFTGNCDPNVNQMQAMLVLPPCSDASTADCIDGLKIGTNANPDEADLVESVGGSKVAASPERGLPAGSTPSIWKAKDSSLGSYEVLVVMKLGWRGGVFYPESLSAGVLPYVLKTGQFNAPTASARILENGRSSVGFQSSAGCIWQDTGRCGVRDDFPKGVSAQIRIRVTNKLGGWFKGRLTSPDIQVAKFSATQNLISVQGQPSVVPQLQASVAKADAPAEVANLFSHEKMPGYAGGGVGLQAGYPNTIEFMNAFRGVAKDTSVGLLSDWSFATIGSMGNQCLADTSKVLGLVTTNASLYDGQAPSFENNSLVYNVGGYHYLPAGNLNLGTYDLILRKETARCLYGFSNAPMSATVSVTSEAGSENVATTNFKEEGDWDHFSAYGFTFSNPKIQVKLQQAGSSKTPSTSPAPQVTSAPLPPGAKKTIWCGKGKVSKIVIAVNPKCPKGWKVIAKPKG